MKNPAAFDRSFIFKKKFKEFLVKKAREAAEFFMLTAHFLMIFNGH